MSSSTPNNSDRRLSNNNAYIVLSTPDYTNKINAYDPKQHKYYLSPRQVNERFPLSSVSAPNKEENIQKENNKNKQTASPMVDEKGNAESGNENINNINTIIADNKEKSPLTNVCDSPSHLVIKNTGAIPKTKIFANLENSSSVQTGMDRYITITKRKSSPRTSKLEPNPKQSKANSESQNRFAILENQENDATPAKTVKNYKPPPIYLREQTSNALVQALTKLLGKESFHVVSLRKGNVSETKIQTYTELKYRTLVGSLDNENKNYYTYQLKSAKGLVVVIKGIDSSVPTSEVKEALESQGYEVKSVHNIINKNKIPQPLFKVEITFNSSQLKKKGDTHPIYDLRVLLNRRVTVEEPIKRKGPLQCMNCQEFGHTKSFCKLPSVCVICGDIHKSRECPYSKPENNYKKCSNCGQNHTANYRGCPVYIQLTEKSKPNRPVYTQYTQYQDSYFPVLPSKSTFSSQHENNSHQKSSYAQTVKKGTATQPQQNKNVVGHTQSKQDSASRKSNVENNTQLYSYAHTLKQGSATPNKITEHNSRSFSCSNPSNEGSPIPEINTQSSIEKLIETMNSFMTNMQNMFQQLMQNQSMLMQILLNKK